MDQKQEERLMLEAAGLSADHVYKNGTHSNKLESGCTVLERRNLALNFIQMHLQSTQRARQNISRWS